MDSGNQVPNIANMEEIFGCTHCSKDIQCKTCKYVEKSPQNSNCKIYTLKDHLDKPNDIYFYGAKCKYYKEADDSSHEDL